MKVFKGEFIFKLDNNFEGNKDEALIELIKYLKKNVQKKKTVDRKSRSLNGSFANAITSGSRIAAKTEIKKINLFLKENK